MPNLRCGARVHSARRHQGPTRARDRVGREDCCCAATRADPSQLRHHRRAGWGMPPRPITAPVFYHARRFRSLPRGGGQSCKNACNAIHGCIGVVPRSSVSTRWGWKVVFHQFCGRVGTGIGFPAAKLIISVLARAGEACCWNRSWRAKAKGRWCKRRRRIERCKVLTIPLLLFGQMWITRESYSK